jgi:hypothetical protein
MPLANRFDTLNSSKKLAEKRTLYLSYLKNFEFSGVRPKPNLKLRSNKEVPNRGGYGVRMNSRKLGRAKISGNVPLDGSFDGG